MKQKFTPYIYILFSILFFDQSYGQEKVLKISTVDSTASFLLRDIQFQKAHFNENELLKALDSVQQKIEEMGFLNFNLDSLVKSTPLISPKTDDTLVVSNTIYTAYFNLKNHIRLIRIYYDVNEVNAKLVSELNEKSTIGYYEIKPENLSNNLQSISNLLEKEGKSFSEVALKNISIKNDTLIIANLFIKKSSTRKIDKIIIKGYTNFPNTYLKHHLKLEENSLFRKAKLDEASKTINVIPFASELKSPEVLFTTDSTIVYLYLKRENTNKFDGLIGFTTKESGQGLSFNGYLDLSLNNLFNSGENFNLVWKNNGNNRQVFNLDVSLPYLFNSKVSPNMALNIYKQDSSFVSTLFKIAIPYQINSRNSIGLTLSSENSSNLLTIANNTIDDFNSTFYGLHYNYEIPNSHPLFKIKFNAYLEALAGKRNSTTNNNQTKFYFKTNFLWSINPKNHIFLQNLSGLINSNKLFDNELLRIGGTNSIRGFDEESILASTFSTLNIEYRHSTNNYNSYLYSITDLGYVEKSNLTSQLFAFGLGYAFSSKLGFINLSYALGKYSDTPFNFNNSRLHLKIVNFF